RRVAVAEGRPLHDDDVDARRRVALIGRRLQDSLFAGESALGRWIRIDEEPFRVVGVLGAPPASLLRDRTDVSEQIWIPLTSFFATASRFGTDAEVVASLLFRVSSRADYANAKRELRHLVARRLQIDADDDEALQFVSAWDLLERIPFEALSG